MVRKLGALLALWLAGCSGPAPGPTVGATVPTTATTARESLRPAVIAPPAEVPADPGPLLTPETPVDLTTRVVPAGERVPRYSGPAGHALFTDGSKPAPTPLPVLPLREPARILGDRRFLAPGSPNGCVALSPDGKLLALGSCLFDTATGDLNAAYEDGGNAIYKLAFSPDGARLYRGLGPITTIPWHSHTLAICDVPGRRQLATATVNDWALGDNGRLLATLESVPYDPDLDQKGPRTMLAYFYPAVRIYDARTLKGVAAYRVRGAQPTGVALSPDGTRVVIGCDGGEVRVWDRVAAREVATLRELCEAPFDIHRPVAHLLAFSPDGETLAAANARPFDSQTLRRVAWWRWPSCEPLHAKPVQTHSDPADLHFSPDGRQLFTGQYGKAVVWDVATGEVRHEYTPGSGSQQATAVAFAAADRVFVPGVRPALLAFPALEPRPWPEMPFAAQAPTPDFATVEPMPPTKPIHHTQRDLPGGGHIAARDGTRGYGLEHFDATGHMVRRYEPGRSGIFAVTPDGKTLITRLGTVHAGYHDYDVPVRFYELATGRELGEIHVNPAVSLECEFAVSPDGQRVVMLHSDWLIRVWDVATRKPLVSLDPVGYWVNRLTFSADGTRLVGSGPLPVLLVWDATAAGSRK